MAIDSGSLLSLPSVPLEIIYEGQHARPGMTIGNTFVPYGRRVCVVPESLSVTTANCPVEVCQEGGCTFDLCDYDALAVSYVEINDGVEPVATFAFQNIPGRSFQYNNKMLYDGKELNDQYFFETFEPFSEHPQQVHSLHALLYTQLHPP